MIRSKVADGTERIQSFRTGETLQIHCGVLQLVNAGYLCLRYLILSQELFLLDEIEDIIVKCPTWNSSVCAWALWLLILENDLLSGDFNLRRDPDFQTVLIYTLALVGLQGLPTHHWTPTSDARPCTRCERFDLWRVCSLDSGLRTASGPEVVLVAIRMEPLLGIESTGCVAGGLVSRLNSSVGSVQRRVLNSSIHQWISVFIWVSSNGFDFKRNAWSKADNNYARSEAAPTYPLAENVILLEEAIAKCSICQ